VIEVGFFPAVLPLSFNGLWVVVFYLVSPIWLFLLEKSILFSKHEIQYIIRIYISGMICNAGLCRWPTLRVENELIEMAVIPRPVNVAVNPEPGTSGGYYFTSSANSLKQATNSGRTSLLLPLNANPFTLPSTSVEK
jgi:hypothetical protein